MVLGDYCYIIRHLLMLLGLQTSLEVCSGNKIDLAYEYGGPIAKVHWWIETQACRGITQHQ